MECQVHGQPSRFQATHFASQVEVDDGYLVGGVAGHVGVLFASSTTTSKDRFCTAMMWATAFSVMSTTVRM